MWHGSSTQLPNAARPRLAAWNGATTATTSTTPDGRAAARLIPPRALAFVAYGRSRRAAADRAARVPLRLRAAGLPPMRRLPCSAWDRTALLAALPSHSCYARAAHLVD